MTLDKNFGQELLNKIDNQHLQPKPRWQFLLKNYIVWLLGALSLVLGSVTMALVLYMLRYDELDVYRRAGGQIWNEALLIVPLFWLVCLILFILFVFYDFKLTKKGYRYSLVAVLSIIILTSVILGGAFHLLGVGKIVDDALGRRAPFYDRIMNPGINFWSQPTAGRLVGVITQQTNADEYLLLDGSGIRWAVLTAGAKRDRRAQIIIGLPARFLGEAQDDHYFRAEEILPAIPSGSGFFLRFNNLPPPGLERDQEFSP
ncbi:MAG: hypothetical protein PHS62_01825 [Patescibacteria group bacterium]|nr:hypothetical protein [Patescibacteria group bacterium]